jgi:hypothetical protein
MTPKFRSPAAMNLPRPLASAALALLLAPLGCAEAQSYYPASTPAVVFPSRAEISRIPAKAPAAEIFGSKDVAVDEWTVESPPLPSDAPYDDPSPWGALLRDLTKTRGDAVSLSPAMRCAAAEIGRFYVSNRALPVERLRRFILARCGGDTTNLNPYVWSAKAPASVSDDVIAAKARDALANAIEEPLAHGHHLAGLAMARDAKRVAVVFAIAEDEARLEPTTRQIDASRHVTIRGTARGDYSQIMGLVNRGDFGVSRCVSDPSVRAPRFAISCEVAPGDSFDWIEVLGQKRGRVMLHVVSDVLAYEGDGSAVRYKAKSYGPASPVTSAPDFARALLSRINDVRKTAKLGSLTLAPKQSTENERLTGTLLDSALGQNDDSADKAAIGLLAGWDVEGGTIRDGHFFLGAVAPTHDATTWLEFAIERPIGRMAILDPDARVIAIGPAVLAEASGLGAAVTTYALFDSDDHTADAALFFRRIGEAREALGLPAPHRIDAPDEMKKLTARVLREETTPQGALRAMLDSAAWQSGRTTYGYVLETNSVGAVDIPDVFLKPGPLSIALTVTHHRAPGAAWGQYVLFTLMPGSAPTPTREAKRAGGSRRAADATGAPAGEGSRF